MLEYDWSLTAILFMASLAVSGTTLSYLTCLITNICNTTGQIKQ